MGQNKKNAKCQSRKKGGRSSAPAWLKPDSNFVSDALSMLVKLKSGRRYAEKVLDDAEKKLAAMQAIDYQPLARPTATLVRQVKKLIEIQDARIANRMEYAKLAVQMANLDASFTTLVDKGNKMQVKAQATLDKIEAYGKK